MYRDCVSNKTKTKRKTKENINKQTKTKLGEELFSTNCSSKAFLKDDILRPQQNFEIWLFQGIVMAFQKKLYDASSRRSLSLALQFPSKHVLGLLSDPSRVYLQNFRISVDGSKGPESVLVPDSVFSELVNGPEAWWRPKGERLLFSGRCLLVTVCDHQLCHI